MQVDAWSRAGDAQNSRKCLYSPENYCKILRAVLKPRQRHYTAALVSNSNCFAQFLSRGIRNYAFSYRCAARSIHHEVTNELVEALPSLSSWYGA